MYAMKTTFLSFVLLLAAGCTSRMKETSATETVQQVQVQPKETENRTTGLKEGTEADEYNTPADEYADYYLVIVNSSRSYKALHEDMFRISNGFHISIDTLGRYYNTETNAIVVPDDDEDEIYRGEYYPRRFESLSLSIENADYYDDTKQIKEPRQFPAQMILVAGMYVQKESADSLRNALVKTYPRTFVQKSKIYTGCMH